MAILQLENGTTYTNYSDIERELAPLGIHLNHWSINPELQPLLAQDHLTEEEKQQVLTALEHHFEHLRDTAGYQSRDLIVLHPAIPNFDGLVAKFNQTHTHTEDEVRYILDGDGIFGFVYSDGTQVELTVQPQEYINVPAGTEHWFYLTSARRIKAVRYFVTTEGWTPNYTNTAIRFRSALTI